MKAFDTEPWLITAAPAPPMDHRWRSAPPSDPVFREAPEKWPTSSPAAAVEAATSALSCFIQLGGGSAARQATSIYDLPDDPVDGPPAPAWDLVLVVDTGPSMMAWYPVANAIAAHVRDLPLFHSVHVVKMRNRRPTKPGDLFDASDQPVLEAPSFADDRSKVTLVLTDGVGAAWHRRLLWDSLHRWATSHTVAILHVLPHHDWSRSGIPTEPAQLLAQGVCCPNKDLVKSASPSSSPSESEDRDEACALIPVLEIRKRWLDQWTDLLLNGRRVHQQVLKVSPQAHLPGPTESADTAEPWHVLMADFHATASEHALNLLVLLAAAPLNRHVMQLVATELVPAATARDLSSILTSGLLVSMDDPVGVSHPYGRITFDFLPEVRQSLLALGESSQTHRVVALLDSHLAAFVPTLVGQARRVKRPDIDQVPALTSQSAPYLEIEHCLLTALSGDTAEHLVVAKTLRKKLDCPQEAARLTTM